MERLGFWLSGLLLLHVSSAVFFLLLPAMSPNAVAHEFYGKPDRIDFVCQTGFLVSAFGFPVSAAALYAGFRWLRPTIHSPIPENEKKESS